MQKGNNSSDLDPEFDSAAIDVVVSCVPSHRSSINNYCIPVCWLDLSLLLSYLQGFWELDFSLFVS